MTNKSHLCDKRGGLDLLNVLKLKGKIVEKDTTISKVSDAIGIDISTFYRKLNDNSFSIREADRIAEVLGLSGDEACAIFFSQYVA